MDFDEPWEFGDVTFMVEERKIYANKAVLAMSSEVFKAMFTSEFKEKKMPKIPLPDKKFDDFLQLMQILHPQTSEEIDSDNVHDILPLAHEYQMHGILKICIERLCFACSPCILSLNMIEKYNLKLPALHKRCMNYMKDTPLSQLKAEDGFEELKPEILIEVLNSKVENLEPLKTLKAEVGKLTNWNWKNSEPELCTGGGYREHKQGESRNCHMCSQYRLQAIWQVLRKY